MRLGNVGEFGLIERIAEQVAGTDSVPDPCAGRIVLGIGDDAAVLEIPPERQVVTTIDTLIEGVHFRRDWTGPEDLGWKSLAVNVSDIAAMGAEPLAALLSLALPETTEVAWVDAFTLGLEECAREYGCALAGGDTVRSPHGVAITVALLGTVEHDRAVQRSGARAGDAICVTGTLGDSAAGLALLEKGEGCRVWGVGSGSAPDSQRPTPYTLHPTPSSDEFTPLLAAHHRPCPRLQAARALAASGCVTAMMDLSDGLASDLRHLAARSGAGARIRQAGLPISEAARAAAAALGVDPAGWALYGGEDYELLFTLPPAAVELARARLRPFGAALTVVGEVVAEGVWLVEADGAERALEPAGFAHFAV